MFRTWEEVMSSEYSYEIYWILGVIRTPSGWMLKFVIRRARTQMFEVVQAPLSGHYDLIIGSMFQNGKRLGVSRGTLCTVKIPDASNFSRVPTNKVPDTLYMALGEFNQNLIAYTAEDKLYLIPASEMIRKVFLLDRYLYKIIMFPMGLFLLISPMLQTNGSHYQVQLSKLIAPSHRFTKRAEHYAWLAFEPAIRRSWDSVRKMSSSEYLDFDPPPIELSLTVSSIQRGNVRLVTEIISIEATNPYSGVLSIS